MTIFKIIEIVWLSLLKIHIYTLEWYKTGNQCRKQSDLSTFNAFLQILKYFFQGVDINDLNILVYNFFFYVVRLCGLYFCTLCSWIGPKERKKKIGRHEIRRTGCLKAFWGYFVYKENFSFFEVWLVAPSYWWYPLVHHPLTDWQFVYLQADLS